MTSRELAVLAGVSQSTVSRVLNGCGGVSGEKKKRVMEMAKKYQFELDVNARGLRTKKPGRAGILLSRSFIGFDVNLFWATIYSKLHIELLNRGYTALPIYGYSGSEKEVLNRLIAQKQTDRVILISTNGFYPEEHLEVLFEKDIPFVCIYDRQEKDIYYPNRNVNVVALDFKDAGEKAGQFLYRMGHRRIAMQTNIQGSSDVSRCAGIRKVLKEKSQIVELPEVSGSNPVTFQGGYAVARNGMKLLKGCTAVLAVNDASALGIIAALQEEGYRVPEDISVAGTNNIPMCTWWTPRLTTVSFDTSQIARKAVEILMEEGKGEKVVITPALVIRDSVKQLI
ncbi:MAG: LacI family DNA-binding transcriptional regulator [Ruminococcus sp.]|jgi:LacI family transcriptional regulator